MPGAGLNHADNVLKILTAAVNIEDSANVYSLQFYDHILTGMVTFKKIIICLALP